MSNNTARNNTLQIFRSAAAAYSATTDPTGLNYGELAWNNGSSKLWIGKQTSSGGTITPYHLNPAASLTVVGLVELATVAETNTGTDAGRAVTPVGLTGWTGDTAIITVGDIGTGTWSGTTLVANKVPTLNDINQPTGNVAMTNAGTSTAYRITGLAAPTSPNDAARKADVDAAVQGLDVRESVKYAATADLPSPTVPASASAWAAVTGNGKPDGVLAAVGDRVLLKSQSPGSENGIYEVKGDGGGGGNELYYARAADLNVVADASANMFFFVEAGATLADTGWVCTTDVPTLSNLVFAQFSGTGSYTAEDGLDITGTAFGIADAGVTLAKMDNMATASIIGRATSGAGVPEILDAAAARGVIGVDAAGTDNSTDVTLAGTPEDYISLSGQALTVGEVDLTDNVTGTLPVGSGGTGATTFATKGVLYGADAGAIAVTAAGTTGQLLTGNGASSSETAPTWQSSLSGITIDCGTFIAAS